MEVFLASLQVLNIELKQCFIQRHPRRPVLQMILEVYRRIYITVSDDTMPLLGAASWVRFLAYLLRHLGLEAMLRGTAFVPPSGVGLGWCRGPQPALFLLLPDISFLFLQKKSSPARAEAAALPCMCFLLFPAVAQACWDSQFCFSGDSFEQINGESFSSPWEIKEYHLMSHTLQ